MTSANFETFKLVVSDEVAKFPSVSMAQRAERGDITIADYHKFLTIVFHQSYNGPASFAMAGGVCDPKRFAIRDYLIKHAEEEHTHWQWVLNDLAKTGYTGPDLRLAIPSPRVSAYISFNFFVALKYPAARIANAAVLEGIGATHAKRFAQVIAGHLKLTKDQLVFALGHSDTDIGHTEEIFRLLDQSNIQSEEWAWLIHSAKTSALLYRDMYNEE